MSWFALRNKKKQVEGKYHPFPQVHFSPSQLQGSFFSWSLLIRHKNKIEFLPKHSLYLQQPVTNWLHDGEHSIVCDSTVAPFVTRHLDVSVIPEVNAPTVAQKESYQYDTNIFISTIFFPQQENTSSQRSPVFHQPVVLPLFCAVAHHQHGMVHRLGAFGVHVHTCIHPKPPQKSNQEKARSKIKRKETNKKKDGGCPSLPTVFVKGKLVMSGVDGDRDGSDVGHGCLQHVFIPLRQDPVGGAVCRPGLAAVPAWTYLRRQVAGNCDLDGVTQVSSR